MKKHTKEVIWSKGRTHEELAKQTSWSSSKDWSGLSGLSVEAYDFQDFIACTAHTSNGRSFSKYFQIPLDKVQEFCDNLLEVRQSMLSQQSKQND
jgi:hypothetical protein